MKTFSRMPSSLALQRAIAITDGVFYNVDEGGQRTPVLVVEHGIRGTQNVNTDKGAEKDIANIQRTESAKLSDDAVAMAVRFDVRTAPLSRSIAMCADPGMGETGRVQALEVRRAIESFLERAQGAPLLNVAQRYARNLLNGRWLWRNRSYAKAVIVRVYAIEDTGLRLIAEQDALKTPLNHFENPTEQETVVAKLLAQGWEGSETPGLRVEATVDFGVKGSVEVFPSQNYIDTKDKGFARSLYKHPLTEKVDLGTGFKACGLAALRDQKIGNALRTIDTWYATFPEVKLVTPVEPLAANLDAGMFLRNKNETAFTLLKSMNAIRVEDGDHQGLFLLAIMIRGGVFGEKGEKPGKAGKGKKKDGAVEAEAATTEASEE